MTANGDVRVEVAYDEDGADMIARLADAGLTGVEADSERIIIDQDGLHGSDPADVVWEMSQHGIEGEAFVFCGACHTWIEAFEDPERLLIEHVDERHG